MAKPNPKFVLIRVGSSSHTSSYQGGEDFYEVETSYLDWRTACRLGKRNAGQWVILSVRP